MMQAVRPLSSLQLTRYTNFLGAREVQVQKKGFDLASISCRNLYSQQVLFHSTNPKTTHLVPALKFN